MEDEGDELQDPLAEGEAACDEDGREQAADDFDVECLDHPVAVAALPGDDPAAVAEAVVLAQRYEALKTIKAAADRHNVPAASNIVEREIVQISRGPSGRKPQGGEAGQQRSSTAHGRKVQEGDGGNPGQTEGVLRPPSQPRRREGSTGEGEACKEGTATGR